MSSYRRAPERTVVFFGGWLEPWIFMAIKNVNFHHLPCLISKIRGLRNIHVWFWLEVHKDWIESNRKKLKILTDLTPLHRKLQLHQVTTFNQKELDFTSKSTTCGWNMMKPKKNESYCSKGLGNWGFGIKMSISKGWYVTKKLYQGASMRHESWTTKKNINSWVKKNSIRVNGNHGTSPCLLVSPPSPGKRSLAT